MERVVSTKRIVRSVLALLVLVIFALPLVLAQMGDRELEVVIGKAESAKSELRYAYMKHFDEEDFEGALSAYQAVVTRFPDSPQAAEAQFRRANVYHWNLIEPEQAIQEYQKVIDAYPDTDYAVEAMIRKGECYARFKQFDRAITIVRGAVESYPTSEYLPQAQATLAGMLLHDLHQDEEAEAIYEDILTNHAGSKSADEARLWSTYIAQKREDISAEDALAAYQSIAGNRDVGYHTRAAAQYMTAYTRYKLRQLEQAIQEFRFLLRNYPEDYYDRKAETHYFLGHLHELMDRQAEALTEYQNSLRSYPQSIWADRAQRGVQSLVERMQRKEEAR